MASRTRTMWSRISRSVPIPAAARADVLGIRHVVGEHAPMAKPPTKRSRAASTLGFALLGLLARRERTGYELAQLMREPIEFFWPARHSQIYPELAALEQAGLVRHTLVRQTERPDKKRYRITPAGRAVLKAWVTSPIADSSSRDELTLRTFSIWLADRTKALTMLGAELERHKTLLRRHEEVERAAREVRSRRPKDRKHLANYATLRRGVSYERHVVGWLGWLLAELERR